MRTVLFAILTSLAIGVAAIAGASAAPINGGAVGQACAAMNSVTHVQHWRWGSAGRWRWRCRRCNRWRCWWVC
jgi:hypothetical protein